MGVSVEIGISVISGTNTFPDWRTSQSFDANSGYWPIELDPGTAKLTTFITHVGRFCFTCLPFGITSAPKHFQRRMTEILGDLEGVICLVDDIPDKVSLM